MKTRLHIYLVLWLSGFLFNFPGYSQERKPLLNRWELVATKLEWAREIQATFNGQSAIDLLNSAEVELRRARQQLEAGRRLLALRMINQADDSINQVLAKLLGEPIKRRREKLENLIQQTKDALAVDDISDARELLETAVANKILAEQAFKEREFQKGLKHLRKAENQALKALDIIQSRDKTIQAQLNEESVRFEELLSQSQNILSSSQEPLVQKNYNHVIELSQKAVKAKSEYNFRQAIDTYHQATRLLLRTIDITEGKTDRSVIRAYEEVSALDELVENIEQKIVPYEEDERIQFFMARIQQLQEDAHQALAAQDYKLVLLNTQLARDLMERIRKKLRGGGNEIQELMDQELKQLAVDIEDINNRIGDHKEAAILISYATLAKNRAKELSENQRSRLAKLSLFMANRFTIAADRLIRKQARGTIDSDSLFKKIHEVEGHLSDIHAQSTKHQPLEARFYIDYAQKMLNLAKDNFKLGYYYVADECIETCKSTLERLRALL